MSINLAPSIVKRAEPVLAKRVCVAPLTPRQVARSRRVIIALTGVLILSIADLAITLANLKSLGMVEANPIARFIIANGDGWALAGYKGLTVGICLLLLYRLRHHIQGEVASWLALLILVGLSLYWGHYTNHMHDPEVISVQMNGVLDERWLTLAD